MTAAEAIQQYGPWAVLVGTFLEGETILVLAILAARSGYLSLQEVAIAAFTGALLGDQFCFHLGRLRGPSLLKRHPHWRRRVARAREFVDRHERWIVLGFRFLYGLRTTVPFALGMGGLAPRRFLLLNAMAVAVWVVIVSALGWALGSAAERLLSDVAHYEWAVLAAVVAIGAVGWLVHHLRSRAQR